MADEDWNRIDATARTVLDGHGGVAKTSAFLASGLTNRQVGALHARKVVERPRSAWFVDPAIPWQGKHAVRVGGVLSCVSAVDSFGLPTPPGSHLPLHVTARRNSARFRHHRDRHHYVVPGEDTEVRLHWTAVVQQPGWRTSLVQALLQAADCVSADWWIAAVDAARHRPRDGDPIMSDHEFEELAASLPGRLRPLLELVDARSESCIETLLRLGMLRRGIAPVQLQFSPDGRRFVDFLVGQRLIVEADGEAFHDPAKDAVRDAAFRSLGYVVLRFPYARIVGELEAVLDEIEAALAQRTGAFRRKVEPASPGRPSFKMHLAGARGRGSSCTWC